MMPLAGRRIIVTEHGLPESGGDKVEGVEADAGGDGSLDEVHADALVPPAEKALAAQHLQKCARDRRVPELTGAIDIPLKDGKKKTCVWTKRNMIRA